MTTTLNCPRCKSLLTADAQFCSRCGLRLPKTLEAQVSAPAAPVSSIDASEENAEAEVIEPFDFQSLVSRGEAFDATESGTTFLASGNVFTEAGIDFLARAPETAEGTPTTALRPPDAPVTGDTLGVHSSVPVPSYTADGADEPPRNTDPPRFTGPLSSSGAAPPQGALDLLPQEEVIQQLGALYLTNKRVILLAPSVIRSAFVRDIDAVGTLTERAPVWQAILGGVLIGLAAAAVYAGTARDSLQPNIGWAYLINPMITAVVLAVAGIFLLARYFLWIKRSLFVSVKGRPLITVSMTDWNSAQLAGMDAFVNSFFQVKDFMSGELMERQIE